MSSLILNNSTSIIPAIFSDLLEYKMSTLPVPPESFSELHCALALSSTGQAIINADLTITHLPDEQSRLNSTAWDEVEEALNRHIDQLSEQKLPDIEELLLELWEVEFVFLLIERTLQQGSYLGETGLQGRIDALIRLFRRNEERIAHFTKSLPKPAYLLHLKEKVTHCMEERDFPELQKIASILWYENRQLYSIDREDDLNTIMSSIIFNSPDEKNPLREEMGPQELALRLSITRMNSVIDTPLERRTSKNEYQRKKKLETLLQEGLFTEPGAIQYLRSQLILSNRLKTEMLTDEIMQFYKERERTFFYVKGTFYSGKSPDFILTWRNVPHYRLVNELNQKFPSKRGTIRFGSSARMEFREASFKQEIYHKIVSTLQAQIRKPNGKLNPNATRFTKILHQSEIQPFPDSSKWYFGPPIPSFAHLESIIGKAKPDEKAGFTVKTPTVKPVPKKSKKKKPVSHSTSKKEEEGKIPEEPETASPLDSSLTYAPRLLLWFTNPDLAIQRATFVHESDRLNEYNRINHAFATAVDHYVVELGIESVHPDSKTGAKNRHFSIPGEMEITLEERTTVRRGYFTYCFNQQEECFHRHFTQVPINELVQSIAAETAYRVDFPSFDEAYSVDEKSSESIAFSDDSYMIPNTFPLYIEIADPKNNAKIRLFKREI